MDILLGMLQSGDEEEGMLAAEALGWMGNREGIGPLSYAFNNVNPQVRKMAAYALGKIDDESIINVLTARLNDEDFNVRKSIIEVLGQHWNRWGTERVVRLILPFVNDPIALVRFQVIDSLGQLKDKSCVGPLINALFDETRTVRIAAAKSLGSLGEVAALKPLESLLGCQDEEVAEAAKMAIEMINTSEDKAA